MPLKIRKRLQPGDWFEIEFGFRRRQFYVVDVVEDIIYATTPTWCVSPPRSFSFDEIYDDFHKGHYIGKGKLRWWWRFLPWRNICVKYSYPKHPIN